MKQIMSKDFIICKCKKCDTGFAVTADDISVEINNNKLLAFTICPKCENKIEIDVSNSILLLLKLHQNLSGIPYNNMCV